LVTRQNAYQINEIHYDNTGTDIGEFIEIAHTGSIAGFSVVLYNGNGGAVYSTTTVPTSTSLPDGNGVQYSVYAYPVDGIQNGSPDGIALVDPNNAVVQFLSYEGTFTAVGGPANGMTSIDIGITESTTTAVGDSLQLINGVWVGPIANTRGAANSAITAPAAGPVGAPVVAPGNVRFIHDIQGTGAQITTPFFVNITAIVTSLFSSSDLLNGFWMQEEDIDADADPNTSEGIYVLCGSKCPGGLTIGAQVNVLGNAGQSFTTTQIDASISSGSVIVRSIGNPLPTPIPLTLPAATSTLLESTFQNVEGMLVSFTTTLAVSEYFELERYGQIVLTESSVPYTFTQGNLPSVSGLAAATAVLAKRRIILDDDNDDQNDAITGATDEAYYYPTGGLSLTNKFRGGDTISGLTGVMQHAFSAWRVRPTAQAYVFAKTNPEPASPAIVGGTLRVTSFNVLNYFTTLDTTSSTSSGPCGPSGTLDCRGADSLSELNRQTAKIVAALDILNPDVAGLVELQNSASDAAISALVTALNAVKGSGTYNYIATGTIGGDAIAVGLIYKPSVVQPVNNFVLLNSSVNPIFIDTSNRPVLIQTFQQISTGERFTISVCHLKSKGSACAGDADKNDGQGNCANTRRDAAIALVDYLKTDPTSSGDPDHLIVGDLNSYAKEDSIVVLKNAGYTDLALEKVGNSTYSYLFDGQRGSLDYVLASASLLPQVTGATVWNINSDEIPVFDYNDELKDVGEAAFERESNAKAIYAPNQQRSSDHDPTLVGLTLKANAPVKAPVSAPVKAPVSAPVTAPVSLPVSAPVTAPITPPATLPVKAPVAAPVTPPITAPVTAPVTSPVTPPVTAPIAPPVTAPVTPPVKAPVAPPVTAPVTPPVTVPITTPVTAPVTPPVTAPVKSPVIADVPIVVPVSLPVPVPTPVVAAPVSVPVKAPVPVPVPIKAPVKAPTKVPTKSPSNPPVTVAPTDAPVTPACGLFGFSFFCPRRGECGFWRRTFNVGDCE
jgi:predicted extracellular nuclease